MIKAKHIFPVIMATVMGCNSIDSVDSKHQQTIRGLKYTFIGRDTVGVYQGENKIAAYFNNSNPDNYEGSDRKSVYLLHEGKVITTYRAKSGDHNRPYYGGNPRSIEDMTENERKEFSECKKFQDSILGHKSNSTSKEDSLMQVIENLKKAEKADTTKSVQAANVPQ